MKKKLHIYCRVSSMVQVDRYSLTAQKNAGIKKAKELDMEPVFYEERGKSADKDNTLNRPEMNRLLKECEEGRVTDIFVTELDRFTRRIELILEIDKMFQKQNIRIHASSTILDLTDSDSRFYTLLQSLLGERENRVKTERSIRGMNQAVRQKNIWIGVFVPYGYKKVDKCLTVDENEAGIYKEMVDMSFKGMGTSAIAANLNERNIPTRGRKVLKNGIHPVNKHSGETRHILSDEILWAPNTVCSIFKNPLYMGWRRWKGELIPAPAIINEETWERVQKELKGRRNYTDKKQQHFILLKGLLRCGVCGRNLYGRIKPDERYYMCSSKRLCSCGLRSPNLDRLNELIWSQVINSDEHLTQVMKEQQKTSKLNQSGQEQKINQLQKKATDLKNRQAKLVELYELSRIDMKTFDDRNAQHESNLAAIDTELKELLSNDEKQKEDYAAAKDYIDSLSSVRNHLQCLDDNEKRNIIRDVVEKIVVKWQEQVQTHLIGTHFKIGEMNYVASSSITPAHLPNPLSFTHIDCVS